MDPAAGGAEFRGLLHPVHEDLDGLGLEVHVAVQSQQEGVVRPDLLPHQRDPLGADQLVAKEVVHVHHLHQRGPDRLLNCILVVAGVHGEIKIQKYRTSASGSLSKASYVQCNICVISFLLFFLPDFMCYNYCKSSRLIIAVLVNHHRPT